MERTKIKELLSLTRISATKWPTLFAHLFAERIMQDALKESDKILSQIAKATNAGIHIEIKTTVPKAKSDCRLYEVGNLLLILRANCDLVKGWMPSPLNIQ